MKTLVTLTTAYLHQPSGRSNLRVLVQLVAILLVFIVAYSVGFHYLMEREGQTHSWLTGFYWTMVAMTTLGFGDVTFQSDLGRLFSVVVVMTGMIFLLIILPFTFIQFFYTPWLDARETARAPRALPESTRGHVLLTGYGPVDTALIQRLSQFKTPYVVIVPEVPRALELFDQGVRVMVGDLDDPEAYRAARVDQAAIVAATQSDTMNTNIAATVREVSERVPIVALAASAASVDILQLAGCREVLQLPDILGRSMARRVFGRDGRSHPIGQVDNLIIAEAAAARTSLVGQTLQEAGLRAQLNLNVAGVWERGRYLPGRPEARVKAETVLLLAGLREDLQAYDRTFGVEPDTETFVVIIGGGRVGRAAARSLAERGVDYRIIEKVPGRARDTAERVVEGDAADIEILTQAGIDRASSVIVTTHEDDMNVYLTLYCRRLRPGILILCRATLERNTTTLHRAGADFVLSLASMGANAIFNQLRRSTLLFVAEGLDVFSARTPAELADRSLLESNLRQDTGCTVLAVRHGGRMTVRFDVNAPLPADAELVLIGDREGEETFFRKYS
jgi:Trk K+ transport system NAD-binding subunit